MIQHRLFFEGKWQDGLESKIDILNPQTRSVIAQITQQSSGQLESTILASQKAFVHFKRSSRFARSLLLEKIAKKIETHRSTFVEFILQEAGKPKALADVEVSRAVNTFTLAAEEVKRFCGEMVPLDTDLSARDYLNANVLWQPLGPVLGITPFNFPLNLVAHKVAPALAVGASIILKPPPQAPGAALLLARLFEEAAKEVGELTKEEIPQATFQVIFASNAVLSVAVRDERLPVLSFTGGYKTGFILAKEAYKKKVLLELGGNAAVYVDEGADLNRAASRIVAGAFAYSGQVCISVQRVFVHEKVINEFKFFLLEETKKIKVGAPDETGVLVGPLIDKNNFDRILSWIEESKKQGAKVLCGGTSSGNAILPTIIEDAKNDQLIYREEVFGPVALLESVSSCSEAISKINDSIFGLQAGVFSEKTAVLNEATRDLEVGGVILNDIPTFRADQMPYGGVKYSGNGREGLKYAMEEYCYRKTVVQWDGRS